MIVKLGPQVQELDPWVTMKVSVKGNQTAVTRRREGGKIRVGPLSSAQVKLPGPFASVIRPSRPAPRAE